MTLLDDDIDDLLRDFRSDEALLDDAIRARMWDRICEAAPDAPEQLDTLAPPARLRVLRGPGAARRAKVLAVAAAVLALLAVAGVAVRSGPGDSAVTAGPSEPLPRDLQSLADAVAQRSVPILGSSADTRYAHLVYEFAYKGEASSPLTVRHVETWTDFDGTGMEIFDGVPTTNDTPDRYAMGPLFPRVLVGLPDDVAAIEDVFVANGVDTADAGASGRVIDALAYVGLPPATRAGLLRYLDSLGYFPVTAPDLAPNLLRVEGPGPVGSTQQADLDLLTGEVVASLFTTPQGGREQKTYTVADLRAVRGR